MSRGYPDWGQFAPASSLSPVVDLGELAARLGSPSLYDRAGNLVWMDSFANTAGSWLLAAAGNGATTAVSTARSYSGDSSLLIRHGDAINDSSSAQRVTALPALSRFGLELAFSMEDATPRLEFQLNAHTGTVRYLPRLRIEPSTPTLQYLDANLDYQDIASLGFLLWTLNTFITIKLVADFSTGKYVRARVGGNDYDLSGIAMYSSASATGAQLAVVVSSQATVAANKNTYIDNVLVTQNDV